MQGWAAQGRGFHMRRPGGGWEGWRWAGGARRFPRTLHACFLLQVKSIEEEEFCAIPMGGALPKVPQRVIGVGGTAGMVHPSTGKLPGCKA
jgi:hypothetical protein